MTSTIPESIILKTDGLGRVRTPLAQREALLDAFERSGLSGMKFAALHGVKYPSFANWVQQRKRRRLMTHAGREGHPGAPLDLPAGGAGAPLQWWEAVVSERTSGSSGPESMAGALQCHADLPASSGSVPSTHSPAFVALSLSASLLPSAVPTLKPWSGSQ